MDDVRIHSGTLLADLRLPAARTIKDRRQALRGLVQRLRNRQLAVAQVEAEMANADAERLQDELGDLLFAMVNVVRLSGMDAEQALSRANEKFERRFRLMEEALQAAGHEELRGLSLQQLDAAWEGVKRRESGT